VGANTVFLNKIYPKRVGNLSVKLVQSVQYELNVKEIVTMQTRSRKIWRDIAARKVRTLLTSLSIFIGVFGVVALSSAGEILINQLEKDIQPDKLSMIQSSVSFNPAAGQDPLAALEALRQQPEVVAVEGRAIFPLLWRLESEENFRETNIVAHSEAFDQSQIEPARLLEGRLPAHTGDQQTIEIAIEERVAREFGLSIGDTIIMRVLTNAQGGDIRTATGTIVGTMFQAYNYSSSSGQVAFPDSLIFASFEDASYIGGFQGFSSIYARYADFETAEAQKTVFQGAIAQVGYIPTFTVTQDPAENPSIESTRRTNVLLIMLAVVALIVSGFLIVNVINSIVVEQRRQIGVMKSLGATSGDTFFVYVGIAFVYGLLGVIPGVLLGIPAGYFFAQGLALQSQTIISEFTFSPIGLVVGVAMGLAIPVIAAIIPVFNGIRVSILEAMTDMGISANFGSSSMDRLIGNLPLPFNLRQAARNAYQKKFRLALTGITLTLASASFMGIFAVFSSLTTLVTTAFDTYGYQVSVIPNTATDFETAKTLIEGNIEGVRSVDPETSLAIEIEGYTPPPVQAGPPGLFAVGVNTENPNILRLDLKEGQDWTENPDLGGVVLSSQLAADLERTVGEEITLIVGNNRQPFQIIGIAVFPGNTVWMDWHDLAMLGGVVDAEGQPYPNSFAVTLENQDLNGRQVNDIITQMNDALLANGVSSSFNNQVELVELINRIVSGVGIVLAMAAFLIALVGAVGLLTTLSMSVFERQKEIGVMRSVGASSSVIATQFLAEGLLVGLVAWVIAAPLSYGISQVLVGALPFGGDFEISYPPVALLVGLLGMIFIVTVASLLPSLAAARRTVSDILRYQ
jgi:putative ABC transport system permease protein